MKIPLALATLAAAMAISFAAQAKDPSADQTFVTQASQGGAAEVELGKVATAQGNSDAVKTFGKRMTDDHTKAGEELKIAASSGGFTIATSPSEQQKADAAKLKSMQGAAFDKAYASAMVKDHKETVALFEKEARSGGDPKLKAFAQETLPTLQEHTKMAEDLKDSAK